MKLLTKEIINRLKKYPLYSQDDKGTDAIAVARFFLPEGAWTWYVLEADLQDNIAFGIVVSSTYECEYGYFSLTELQELRSSCLNLPVERDKFFKPTKLSDIDDFTVQRFLNKLYKED